MFGKKSPKNQQAVLQDQSGTAEEQKNSESDHEVDSAYLLQQPGGRTTFKVDEVKAKESRKTNGVDLSGLNTKYEMQKEPT